MRESLALLTVRSWERVLRNVLLSLAMRLTRWGLPGDRSSRRRNGLGSSKVEVRE
jgi:hypothetical protein